MQNCLNLENLCLEFSKNVIKKVIFTYWKKKSNFELIYFFQSIFSHRDSIEIILQRQDFTAMDPIF